MWQLLKQLLNKIYYTRNQVLLYLWEIKFTLKRWIVLCNFRGCTYMHTYIIIPCKEMLQGVSLKLLFCQGTLHIMIYVKNWPISTVKNILSYSCIDFFSIHANFLAQKSLIGTCPGFEPVTSLSHNRWLKCCNVELKTTLYAIQMNIVIGNIMEFSSGYRACVFTAI